MKRKCPVCRGELQQVDDIVSELYGYVFVESGERCTKRGEEFIYEKTAQRTIDVARRLGIWPSPLKLHRNISRSGRGLVLRIPSDVEKGLKLKEGKAVSIFTVGKKKIVVEIEE